LHTLAIQPVQQFSYTSGWASLLTVGSHIGKNDPSFDPRNYGCQKLGELVRRQRFLEVRETPSREGSTTTHVYVRLK